MEKDNIFEFPHELKDALSSVNDTISEMQKDCQKVMAPILAKLNDLKFGFSQEAKDVWKWIDEKIKRNEINYREIMRTHDSYFKKEGIITSDWEKFINWFYGIYCDNVRSGLIDDLTAHHFKLFHEYKVRMFTGKWSDEQEIEYLSFDSNDATNPLIFDIDLVTGLHNNFRSYIFETTDIDTFKNYFRKNPMPIKKREGITISELCYLFGKIEHKQTGVSNFAEWMKFHIGKTNYGSKKNEFIEMVKDASAKRNNFSLTAPQQKALANKDKIDNLLNQMHTE